MVRVMLVKRLVPLSVFQDVKYILKNDRNSELGTVFEIVIPNRILAFCRPLEVSLRIPCASTNNNGLVRHQCVSTTNSSLARHPSASTTNMRLHCPFPLHHACPSQSNDNNAKCAWQPMRIKTGDKSKIALIKPCW